MKRDWKDVTHFLLLFKLATLTIAACASTCASSYKKKRKNLENQVNMKCHKESMTGIKNSKKP
ncbi:CLUMA_CG019764, isoform A [Clunio marinus]|uniref:CLUMA_CG019764, isoform A n=1 Tax=Clunio marinus TaxID=568069 RepID=A0A1J1J2E4_9DIPT|nr:CLUMA_CG019764, isoform A [Clunio marinus]